MTCVVAKLGVEPTVLLVETVSALDPSMSTTKQISEKAAAGQTSANAATIFKQPYQTNTWLGDDVISIAIYRSRGGNRKRKLW